MSPLNMESIQELKKKKKTNHAGTTVDEELSIKLESELQLELEMAENEEDPVPLSIKEFMDSSPFKVTTLRAYFYQVPF